MAIEIAGAGDYDESTIRNQYVTVPGVIQCPIAQQTAGHRLIRLHGGYGTRVVKWTAERSGRPPVIPAAVNTSVDGDTLLGYSVMPTAYRPNNTAGGYDWHVSGEYTYAQETPRIPGQDALPAGAFPFGLTLQDGLASAIVAPMNITGGQPDYVTIGADTFRSDGNYYWPFTTLAPVFSSESLI